MLSGRKLSWKGKKIRRIRKKGKNKEIGLRKRGRKIYRVVKPVAVVRKTSRNDHHYINQIQIHIHYQRDPK